MTLTTRSRHGLISLLNFFIGISYLALFMGGITTLIGILALFTKEWVILFRGLYILILGIIAFILLRIWRKHLEKAQAQEQLDENLLTSLLLPDGEIKMGTSKEELVAQVQALSLKKHLGIDVKEEIVKILSKCQSEEDKKLIMKLCFALGLYNE